MSKINNIQNKIETLANGIQFLKNQKKRKFLESVDVTFNLNINVKKIEQNIRNTVVLPHGTGKKLNIAVFTTGRNVEIATNLGINTVGMENIIDTVKKNKKKFNVVIATPEAMILVGKLGSILGPRGIMPNPKFGTVTTDIKKCINEIRKGKINYKNDKNGIIHSIIGKINFSNKQLTDNFLKLYESIKKNKPSQLKGTYFNKITLSTTMSPSIEINISSI